MKKIILYLLLLCFLVYFVINIFNTSLSNFADVNNDESAVESKASDPFVLSNKPNNISYKPTDLTTKSGDLNLKNRLVRMVEEEKDGSAAFELVSLNSVCSLAQLTDEELQNFINNIGNLLLDDPTGRNFFNQTLIYPGVKIDNFDDLSTNLTNKESKCDGFEKDDYEKIFHYLNVAAERGYVEAKVGLWKISHPSYVKHKAEYHKNPNNLEYLNYVQLEKEWNFLKRKYLEEAAEYGESRAWVLIADAMSSENWETPNVVDAYMYYHAAADIYELPFIYEQINRLESIIEDRKKEIAKNKAKKLVELHLERF